MYYPVLHPGLADAVVGVLTTGGPYPSSSAEPRVEQ